jgi:CheY-like chemotaxis protein/anti-sigma regulatory factor (Ser/Thr protein kinase)
MKSTEQANRAKSEFLSSMSHELRTPLNSILGFGQILNLNLEEPLSDGQKSCVDQILSGGQHLLELINEILDLARIEAGEVNLSLEAIQVTPLLDKCLNLVQTQAQDRGIEFIKEYAPEEFTIVADYTRIQQVLLNLLSNAIKYNQANGTITINCWETSTGMLRISVTDTGQGIPANKHDEIFQPFNRLGVKAAEIEGTGIGLTVSRTLVKIMEGNIGFDSKAGVGSTFWVEFLLLAEQILDDETNAELYGTNHKPAFPDISGTLLYVEDNPSNMQLMKTLVENIRGLTMISANTAELGIEMARTQQPDVVIFDINLPGMSGIEALGGLKKLKEIAHIPILALSASAGKKDIERGLEAGFQSYLTKPLQITELVDTLKDLLDARSDSIH